MAKDSDTEVHLAKLELTQGVIINRLDNLANRTKVLEDDKTEQIGILARLGQTVETLALTVSTLSHLTKELDMKQEVFTAKFNIIIGILSAIGVALLAGVSKILFFSVG